MNESPLARASTHLAPARGRPLRSTSETSPTRHRNTDDLLSNLTPRTVVDAFRNPSGTLRACMQAATPAEQAFALRVAIASNSIHEWLAELSAWSWPTSGGSAGFEMPAVKRKLFASPSPQQQKQEYYGSVLASDVERYERRIDRIAQELEELDIEEIKSQVLNNHIMPLSRPGTPMMDSARSVMSLSSISRLDDLTAIVMATTVQALPNLSRLVRLMGTWNFRLLVLRKIPVFLTSIAGAETALQSGWKTINAPKGQNGASHAAPAPLSREECDVMKAVLGSKVAKAGRDLDAMLDMLEGQQDTLPAEWIDRIDTLEQGYGEWTVACDRKLKEADLAAAAARAAPKSVPAAVSAQSLGGDGSNDSVDSPSSTPAVRPPVIKVHHTADDGTASTDEDCPDTDNEFDAMTPDGSDDVGDSSVLVTRPDAPNTDAPGSDSELSDIAEDGVFRMEDTTGLDEGPSMFTDSFSSDMIDQSTPERPRPRPTDATDIPETDPFRSTARSFSVSFNDMPTVAELPSFPSPPGTPSRSGIVEDDGVTEPNTPVERSVPGLDDHLQKQISEILESVPAKIRLSAELPAVNLNPPDFKMPTLRRSSRPEVIHRTQSNTSMRSAYSRSATPSFTLAPVRRPRQQRGNQEIKIYHLSRSTGEAPIKLFIRCVGEHGERVMVRVGGGWADLGEYLKEYASHHLRRAVAPGADSKVEVKDIPRPGSVRPADSTPPSRPSSAMDSHSPISPLKLRKTRNPAAADDEPHRQHRRASAARPKTPLANISKLSATPPSDASSSVRSCSSSRVSWDEEDATTALGMAGPRAKRIEMSEERKAWVETIERKVRIASYERKPAPTPSLHAPANGHATRPASAAAGDLGGAGLEASLMDRGRADGKGKGGMFGEMGKAGSTTRLFRKAG
ncbi:uncharacterized protein C8A04DRAFT_9227 [Dichotomopilus funicola]|uniref:GAR domain-containing protein n=1 Tax=Dichotomopilus funicola TaxID=1934379 RepID=A0AAN6V9C1_9PEZI|nr:hypothetical protein C8A04DRAFT_9227 [Dichotomopilus funicola]